MFRKLSLILFCQLIAVPVMAHVEECPTAQSEQGVYVINPNGVDASWAFNMTTPLGACEESSCRDELDLACAVAWWIEGNTGPHQGCEGDVWIQQDPGNLWGVCECVCAGSNAMFMSYAETYCFDPGYGG